MIEIPAEASLEAFLERYSALRDLSSELQAAYALLAESLAAQGKILVCGNGGSAADAEHMVGELVKSFAFRRPVPEAERAQLHVWFGEEGRELGASLEGSLPALSLVSAIGLQTAIGNDMGYDYVFAQQVYGLGRRGDVLVAISTSGRSKNVLHACRAARLRGIKVLGLTGQSGEPLGGLADVTLRVPSAETHIIQEYHLPIYHWLCFALEAHFFGHHGRR